MTYLFRLARHRLGDSCRRCQIAGPGTVHTCMAGMADVSGMGIGGGPGCVPATTVFFSLVVFDPYDDAAATAHTS